MGAPGLEVADIFRTHGPAWRQASHNPKQEQAFARKAAMTAFAVNADGSLL
ncbi:MAG: hypothetical protein NVSMB6_25670 [Burkholderiaceae bacterium]